jgi:hypothetical protein
MRLTLEQRTAALLALVEDYRARRCAELIEPAQEQARAILRTARAEGRRRVHTTIAEARARLAAEVGAAQARLATERRLAEQRRAVQVLQQGWTALRQQLGARWRDDGARRQWLDAHLARALRVLTPDRPPTAGRPGADRDAAAPWQIEFAPDWPQDERQEFAARLAAASVAAVNWLPRPEIEGGVRIRAGANVVDATIDGLLADRAAIEGRLLDLLRADAAADRSAALSGAPARSAAEGR